MTPDSSKPYLIQDWQVDYQDGRKPRSITVPHSWNLDKSVEEEGPTLYTTFIEKQKGPAWLVFHGVSYQAKVKIDGQLVADHKGIWDSFSIPLSESSLSCTVEVEVTKNGGKTWPVASTLAGFLPYVYQTFGGIFREVELVTQAHDPFEESHALPKPRVHLEGSQLFLEGQPFYMRGILHWGWYPRIGRPHPSREAVKKEIARIKSQGFNVVKFCLWLPPHYYLDLLEEEGMEAWIELPIWLLDAAHQEEEAVFQEVERIVRQYRHHKSIIAWTCGCELGDRATSEFRKRLYSLVKGLTGSPLVRDSSGGAEMYGGSVQEFADYEDFHPYADLHLFRDLLSHLIPPNQTRRPCLMGEYGDNDTHRDLARLQDEHPYWASILPEYNAQGVRWAYDLPRVMGTSDFAHEHRESRHQALMESSLKKNAFIREQIARLTRSFQGINGFVLTGLRDTPVSTSGVFDDWNQPKFSASQAASWNGDTCLFLMPRRSTPFIDGSNRAGFLDDYCHFTGHVRHVIGVHSIKGGQIGGFWRLRQGDKVIAHDVIPPVEVQPNVPTQLTAIEFEYKEFGTYQLEMECGDGRMSFPIEIVSSVPFEHPLRLYVESASQRLFRDCETLNIELGIYDGGALPESGIVLLSQIGTVNVPFWRSSAYQYQGDLCQELGIEDNYHRLLPMSSQAVIDPHWLDQQLKDSQGTILMKRIDTLNYGENPVLVKANEHLFITSLRPQGGEGSTPSMLNLNPSGIQFLRDLSELTR